MNNSDFLSEAVALDLGKSGVKVAETLEIEVGEEWWRLINAADVMDVTKYNYRKLADPVAVDGKLKLASFANSSFAMLTPFMQSSTLLPNVTQFVLGAFSPIDSVTPNIVSTATFPRFSSSTGTQSVSAIVRAGNIFTDIAQTSSINGLYPPKWNGSFWDSVNMRFVHLFVPKPDQSSTQGGAVSIAQGTPWAVVTSNPSSNVAAWVRQLFNVQCFSQNPSVLYKLYIDASKNLWIDVHGLLAGETLQQLQNRLYSVSGSAVKITPAGTNYECGGLFYSRWHGSVGVLWRDPSSKLSYYVLEKDGWNTLHTLPDFLDSKYTVKECNTGTIAVPEYGEFLIVGAEKREAGNIVRPTGYSFPVNLQILGTGYIGDGKTVILGIVGSTVYRYEISLETMTIFKVTSVNASADIGILASIKLNRINGRLMHKDAACEYWAIEVTYRDSDRNRSLPAYNTGWWVSYTSTGEFKWMLNIGGTHDVFPNTSLTTGSTKVNAPIGIDVSPFYCTNTWRAGKDHVLLFQDYSPTNLEYYIVPFSALNVSTDKASAISAIKSQDLKFITGVLIRVAQNPADTCFEDEDFYYLFGFRTSPPQSATRTLVAINKQTFSIAGSREITGLTHALFTTTWVSPGYCHHDFSQHGDLLAVSFTPTSSTTHTTLTAYKPTWFSGTVKEEIMKIGVRNEIRPHECCSAFSKVPSHHIWAIASLSGANMDFVGIDATSYGSAGLYRKMEIELGHTHYRFMTNPEKEELWSVSNIVDGEIKYDKFKQGGTIKEYFAIDVEDNVYTVDFGYVRGGVQEIQATGNIMTAISGGGSNWIFETGASPTEGEGVTPPSGEESAILYTYVSQNFTPYPFAREGIRAELSNISKTTKITLPETRTNLIRGLLASGTDFRGSRCILRRIFPDHADTEGSDIVLLDGYIQDWSYVPGKKGIAFTVSKTLIDVGAQFPKRLMNMGCSHVFKGERCKYLGETGRCLKTKAFCQFLNNQNQFGGFPWVAARQRRVMWR